MKKYNNFSELASANSNNTAIFNDYSKKPRHNFALERLVEAWNTFDTEKNNIKSLTEKMTDAKNAGDNYSFSQLRDKYLTSKGWVIHHAETITKLQGDIQTATNAPEFTNKPELPEFIYT